MEEFSGNEAGRFPTKAVVAVKIVNPQRTEHFLLQQPDILDASVWIDEGELRAHVRVPAQSLWTETSLKARCYSALGLGFTPASILIIGAQSPADQATLYQVVA